MTRLVFARRLLLWVYIEELVLHVHLPEEGHGATGSEALDLTLAKGAMEHRRPFWWRVACVTLGILLDSPHGLSLGIGGHLLVKERKRYHLWRQYRRWLESLFTAALATVARPLAHYGIVAGIQGLQEQEIGQRSRRGERHSRPRLDVQ